MTAREKAARLREIEREAAKIRRELRRSRPRKGTRALGATKEERRETRNARAAEIRDHVMKRAGERCEWCGRGGFVLEWHHVFSGRARRALEFVDSTCAICADCHRAWHRSDLDALRMAAGWATRLETRSTLDEINRRIAKVLEARGVPVRIVVGGAP